jgi:Flp pilus assembly protein TadG
MNGFTLTKRGHNGRTLLSQRGVVVPIVVIGLLALLGVAGLAIDGSHALANKTRMQNTVDASALAAAKVLDITDGDTGLATAAANSLFAINADGAGNHEMDDAYDAGDISITVQYSGTLNPFVPGSFVPGSTSWFVRVIATGFDTRTTFSTVLGITDIPTPATAVAGPSGPLGVGTGAEICDIAPIAVCAGDIPADDPLTVKDETAETLRVLKPNPGVHGDVGPGNYKMLRMDCAGGACLRENMAGAFGDCASVEEPVETEPGVSSGPVSQGFNTRFNLYQGAGLNSTDYPPDEYITEQGPPDLLKSCNDPVDPLIDHIYMTSGGGNGFCNGFDPDAAPWAGTEAYIDSDVNYNYADYSGPSPGSLTAGGVKNRRLLTFPLIECDGDETGQSTLTVTGFACFFMLQAIPIGQADGAGQIFGQYISKCEANGSSGSNPGGGPTTPLMYKIQLYKNPDSGDS